MSFYTNTANASAAETCYDALAIALAEKNILSDMTLIGALATVRTEGDPNQPYVPVAENITQAEANAKYNGILGNALNSNDGYLYRGQGLPQLTGKDNYIKIGTEIGVDLVNDPAAIMDVGVSARALVQFFIDNGIDILCNNKDWVGVRTKYNGINSVTGQPNGLAEFESIVTQFINIM